MSFTRSSFIFLSKETHVKGLCEVNHVTHLYGYFLSMSIIYIDLPLTAEKTVTKYYGDKK